ncbi:MAG: UDP-N-acetylmuramoyl-tripeptide--D-alanyl-D-alanine ligase [Patescibacteria group bacterium]
MKSILKSIIVSILTLEARLVLWRYHPRIIGVTGSVGKTSAKDAIALALQNTYLIKKSEKSFNSELGVPLTVLGCDTAWGSVGGWIKNVFKGLWLIIGFHTYPEVLVLEMGVDHPGDMERLVSWIHLDVAVVTHIGEEPVHVEFFETPEALADEKMKIVRGVKKDGAVVLTHDDPVVMRYRNDISQKVITFGFSEGASVRGGYYTITHDTYGTPTGIAAKILIGSNVFPFAIQGTLGRQFVYPMIIAAAVAEALEVNMVDILSALEGFTPPGGRMRLLSGMKETVLIDDTYNASPVAVKEALATLQEIRVRGKKVAVLGDMRELGKRSGDLHRSVGRACAGVVDILVTIGSDARVLGEAAKEAGVKRVEAYGTSLEAAKIVPTLVESGDCILVKGSQGIRAEHVVKALLANPRDEKYLVRQGREWEKR